MNLTKKTFPFLLLLIWICAFTSCRKLITDQFPDKEPKPVVNSIIRAGETIFMHVSLSGKIDTMQLSGAENATVQLYVDGVWVDNLVHTKNGFYESNILGEQQKRYTFHVTIPNFSTIICETFLPNSEFIRSIQHINDAGRDSDGISCPALKITFTTNPEVRQYFQLNIATLWESYLRDSTGWFIRDSNGNYISYYATGSIELLNLSDPVILGEGLPIPVFSNRMISDTTYTMYLEYTTNSAGRDYEDGPMIMGLYPLLIELKSIDSSYYHYLRSLYLYERGLYSSWIGEIYPPHQLYSNINGGYGLVGSFSKHVADTIFPKR
jgi:hypothetical protein